MNIHNVPLCFRSLTVGSEVSSFVMRVLRIEVTIVLKMRLKRLEQSGIVGIPIRTAHDELIIIRLCIY